MAPKFSCVNPGRLLPLSASFSLSGKNEIVAIICGNKAQHQLLDIFYVATAAVIKEKCDFINSERVSSDEKRITKNIITVPFESLCFAYR